MKKYGFVKVAAAVPHVEVADCAYNIARIEAMMRQAAAEGVECMAFPELALTAYTAADLFGQQLLLGEAENALLRLVEQTRDLDIFTFVGVPLAAGSQLVNAAVAFQKGRILGVVPKTHIPNYKEFQEARWFTSASHLAETHIRIGGNLYPLDRSLLFESGQLVIGAEICEDLWMPVPPSSHLALSGANLIFNLSASNELIGKHAYRRQLVAQQSARCMAGYVYASAGFGESTTDLVFAGSALIAENGAILAESQRFSLDEQLLITEIDLGNLQHDRLQTTSFRKSSRQAAAVAPPRVSFSRAEVELAFPPAARPETEADAAPPATRPPPARKPFPSPAR